MIDRPLEIFMGEGTNNYNDSWWDLSPAESLNLNGELGILEPLRFDQRGLLLTTMKNELVEENNLENIDAMVEKHNPEMSAQLEDPVNGHQAALSVMEIIHSNPETPAQPDHSLSTESSSVVHAQSDSGHAAQNDLQEHLRMSHSPFQIPGTLPGSTGNIEVNHLTLSRRLSHSHHPQYSSPLAQQSHLYNPPNFHHQLHAHDDGAPYEDGEGHPAYPESLQSQAHLFNGYGSYSGSPANHYRRRGPQFVVPSNDNRSGRSLTRQILMEPVPQFENDHFHPGLRPNFPSQDRAFNQSNVMFRNRLSSQASPRYTSQPQHQSPYSQASGVGRTVSFQPEGLNDDDDAEYTTSSGYEPTPYRQGQPSGYELTEPTGGHGLLYKDLKMVKAERKAITRRDLTDDESFPKNQTDQRRYVKRMLDAMNDMNIADDNIKMQGIWTKQKKNQRDVELSCWHLLDLCMKAQSQEEHLEPKATPKPINTYTTFEHRVSEICKTLQQSKTICKHMLMPQYTSTFVDDPEAAFSRVRNNRNVNNKKRIYLQQAKSVAQQQKEEEATARQGAREWTEDDVAEEDFEADFVRALSQNSPASRAKPKRATKKRKVEDDDDDAPFRTPAASRRTRRNTSMYQLAPLENGTAQIIDTSQSVDNRRRTRRATTGGDNLANPDYTVDDQDDDEYFQYHMESQDFGYNPVGEYSADYPGPQEFPQPQEVQPRKRNRR